MVGWPQIMEHESNPNAEKDQAGSTLEQSLAELGLCGLQRTTYLCLLQNGPSSARFIGQSIRVNRTDVYRILRVLSARGLVNTIMEEPNRYEAVKPDIAVKTLLSEMEERVMSAKKTTSELIMRLNSIGRVDAAVEHREPRVQFKLLTGKPVIDEWRKLLRSAQHEVLRVWSPVGIRMNYAQGLIDDFKECVNRGIKIRAISEINRENVFEAEEFSSLIELRHCDGLADAVRYQVVDDSQVIISSMDFKTDERRLEGVITNKQVLVNGFKKEFEEMWRRSMLAKTRIAKIRQKK